MRSHRSFSSQGAEGAAPPRTGVSRHFLFSFFFTRINFIHEPGLVGGAPGLSPP